MRSLSLLLGVVVLVASAGCVDGVTPDCSSVNCGTPTADGSVVLQAAAEAATDGAADATTDASADANADARDGSVDAKTD
jgi:hypothetical protein